MGSEMCIRDRSSIGETSPAIEAEPEVDVDDGPDKLLEADVSAIG